MQAKGTNLGQIFMPVFGLFCMWFVGFATGSMLPNLNDVNFFVPFPYIFGLDYKPIQNLVGDPLMLRNCDKWFFTEFD